MERPGCIGAGLEWSRPLEADIMANLDQLSCFELIPENFFGGGGRKFLAALGRAGIPVLVHGVELSIGTAEPLKSGHLDKMLAVADQVNCINVSDHLCMTEAGGVEIGQLTPIPWTIEAADAVCRKVERVQKRLKVPFLLENITNRFVFPDNELTETEFINRILRRTGCGMLLDLNNVHTNAINFGFDPFDWIEELNLQEVQAIHLAGGYVDTDGTLVDSHDRAVPQRVWALLKRVCELTLPDAVIVERTGNYPEYAELLGEVAEAERILRSSPHYVAARGRRTSWFAAGGAR